MSLKTQLLSDLTISGGTGAILEGGELEPEIPAVIQPTFELWGAVPNSTALSTTALGQSGFVFNDRFKPASTGLSTDTIITLGVGLWEVLIEVQYSADFAVLPTAIGNCFFMDLLDPAAGAPRLFTSGAQANVQNKHTFLFRLHLRTTPWAFRWSSPATGVGQTLYFNGSAYARRLL